MSLIRENLRIWDWNIKYQIFIVWVIASAIIILFNIYVNVDYTITAAFISALTGLGILVNSLSNRKSSSDTDPKPGSDNNRHIESFENRKQRAKDELSDLITLQEDSQGNINVSVDPEKIRGIDRKAMLHVFGIWQKFDDGDRTSPKITKEEIRKRADLSSGEAEAFLNDMEDWITREPRIKIRPGDPLPVLHTADVFVNPSYQDGLGYAPLEALACNVPVIVTEDTGMKESVVDGQNGYIIPTGDGAALLDRLCRLCDGVPLSDSWSS